MDLALPQDLPRHLISAAARSAFLGSLFFLGYFLFQVPGVAYARRKSVSRLVFYSLFVGALLAALTGVIHQFWLLALDRLLLGVAESLIFPAMLILLTNWFTRAERSRANTILILGNPDHGVVDVRRHWISDQSRWLANGVRHRGTAVGVMGLCLAVCGP